MSTISVPLTQELERELDTLIAEGVGSSRADVMRQALAKFVEDTAVLNVLIAEQEVKEGKVLRGDARKILLGE